MFAPSILNTEEFARRLQRSLPEYLPGVDTGAFEPTDRRRCWNKSLKSSLNGVCESVGLTLTPENSVPLPDQLSLTWSRQEVPRFTAVTGWGDRRELDRSLLALQSFKCPEKLLVYTCAKWQDAVRDQISGSLFRYPYHLEGERYLFLNLLGSEHRFFLSFVTINRSGAVTGAPPDVQPVPGSPFAWRHP